MRGTLRLVETMHRVGTTLLLEEGVIRRARRRRGIMLRRVRAGTMQLLERVGRVGFLEVLVRMGRGSNRVRKGSLRRMTFLHLGKAREALEARWINIGRTSWVKWVSRMQCEITCLGTNPSSTNGSSSNKPTET